MTAHNPPPSGNGQAGRATAEVVAAAVLELGGDEVLANLARAEEAYRAARADWADELGAARQTRDELVAATDARRRAEDEVRGLRAELAREKERARRDRERAKQLAAALKDIHRAIFTGNVYDLVLRACTTLTGATRGVYVTAAGTDRFQVRAAIDVDGYPRKPPSEFLRAVCRAVIADEDALVANDPAEFARFPAPDGPGEAFADMLAAPVVLMRAFNGVVVLADKPGGFDDADDAELVMSVGDQAGVAVENLRLQEDLLKAYFSVVGVMADAIEAKDPYTHGHCEAVARYARATAARLTDSDQIRSVCCYGGLLHDIGKIGVSDGVLNKPGKLTPEEWLLMQSHVRIGHDLLAHVPALDGVSGVVLHHHERYDGTGYPGGLKGDQIPLAARIVGAVDAYSAMTSKRSYKDSMPPAEARAELVRCKGSHFDPRVVDAFLAVLDDESAERACDDGCGLPPRFDPAHDFRHAIRPVPRPGD